MHERQTPRYTTHPRAVAGIMLIASLFLFGVVFWVVIGISAIVAPIKPTSAYADPVVFLDYLSSGRVFLAAVIGILGTAGFWLFVPDDL